MKNFKLMLFVFCILTLNEMFASGVSDTIPKNFNVYKGDLKIATDRYINKLDLKYLTKDNYYPYYSALIEHESCITLTHSRCWSAKSELNTKWPNGNQREQGVGFGQITRAYTQAGTIRLDVLTDLRKRYPSELNGLTWTNIKYEPELQLRAILLLWIDNYNRLPSHISEFDKMAMSDSAYNGGYGYILKDRKTCGLKANCDPDLWLDNVETINNRGNRILYSNRSAYMINRDHVRDVLFNRMGKYYNVGWD